MPLDFSISWDYRCPYARNAAEHVVVGLGAGADWEVQWIPFSLNQAHVEEGGTPVWDDPTQARGLLAMQAGIVVRDRYPAAFPAVHLALFAARHDEGRDIREGDVVAGVLEAQGVSPAEVFAEIEQGWALDTFRKEHEAGVADHNIWGVPTFVREGQAVFVRLMTRPRGDGEVATSTVTRVLDLVSGWPALNEFKHTTIPR